MKGRYSPHHLLTIMKLPPLFRRGTEGEAYFLNFLPITGSDDRGMSL